MDRIELRSLEVECIIGVRSHERLRKQRVLVDLDLTMDLAAAAHSGRIGDTCDYDVVARQVSALLEFREYQLMETATEELAAILLGAHPAIERVSVSISKPNALSRRALSARVRIERGRDAYTRHRVQIGAASVDRLIQTWEAGLYLITPPTGTPFELPKALRRPNQRSAVWLLTGRVQQWGKMLSSVEDLIRLELYNPLVAESGARLCACTIPPLDVDADSPTMAPSVGDESGVPRVSGP